MDDAALLVGIDAAGYGPMLGPLVVSATAFEVPRAAVDLRRLLNRLVAGWAS